MRVLSAAQRAAELLHGRQQQQQQQSHRAFNPTTPLTHVQRAAGAQQARHQVDRVCDAQQEEAGGGGGGQHKQVLHHLGALGACGV
jgi:hypothetical protein